MFALAMITLAVALAASVWTTAVPDLLWLDRARREDAWLDSIEALHLQLDVVLALDDQVQADVMALTI